MKQKMTLEECLAHIPQPLTPEIKEYAMEEVFKHKRYIFVTRDGKYRTGYCTYCHNKFNADMVRHNQTAICPICRSECTGKSTGLGRKKMIDEAYYTYYMKSAIDPNAIVAIGTYVVRDYYWDYWNVKTHYLTTALYVFLPGIDGTMFRRWAWFDRKNQKMNHGQLERAGSCKCQFFRDHYNNIHTTYSRESLAAAVVGTPYRFSTWEQYRYGDMTDFFDLYSRYPCIEYLTKLGLKGLVEEKLAGERTYGAIQWRGKNVLKVLGMAKQELNLIRVQNVKMTMFALHLLRLSKKEKAALSPTEAVEMDSLSNHEDALNLVRQQATLKRIHGYLKKQLANKHYKYPTSVITDWRDYIEDCKKLEMDLMQEAILFPRDLHKAHQRTIKLVEHKADEILNKKIQQRAEKIRGLYFEKDGLLIRPAISTNELIAEGKALEHCVGRYAKGYAEGKGDILFVRRVDEPDKPYFTVEVRGDFVAQCRGMKNKSPEKDVESFMSKFKKERLQKPVKSNKKREVAV